MRVHNVPGHGVWRVAAGRRDPFLHRRRIRWGDVLGWMVLIASGLGVGWIAAMLAIETWG